MRVTRTQIDAHDDPFGSLSVTLTSTVDRVADELRRAVFEGDLEAGTPLREVALAESLGVSRSTLREALGILVGEGIAVREPNRGVAVASPDPAAIVDVCRCRLVLEGAGVRAWATATEAARDVVRRALDDYIEATEAGVGYQVLNERHLAFHISLVALTGSPRLVAMAEALMAELKVALAQIDRIKRNAHDQADAHKLLLDLLEAGDVNAVSAEHERHLADAEVAILAALAG